MNRRQRKLDPDRRKSDGVALIIVLLMLLLLSTLVAALIFSTNTQIWASYSYRLGTQARYTAETGAQNAVNWLVYTYTKPTNLASFDMTKSPVQYNGQPVVLSAMSGVASNYPDAAQQDAFNDALKDIAVSGMGTPVRYSVFATLLRMRSFTACFSSNTGLTQTWQITSQATIAGTPGAAAQVVETFENPANPCLTYAAFATGNTCSSINFQSGGFTDSYDSSQGTYAATKQNNNGNLGTNGNLLNDGSLTINGSLSTPSGNTTGPCPPMSAASGNPLTATGGLQTLTPPSYPNPTPPVTPTNTFTMPGSLSPGNFGNATGNCGTVHFTQPGTYNFNSIDCDSGATFVLDAGGPVILNVGGVGSSGHALNFQSGLSINAGGTPSDFQIVYGGTAGLNLQSGAGPVNALIYAPNAPLDFQSTGDFYGAMVTKTINFQSNGKIHYDRALQKNVMQQGSYHAVSFSRSQYK